MGIAKLRLREARGDGGEAGGAEIRSDGSEVGGGGALADGVEEVAAVAEQVAAEAEEGVDVFRQSGGGGILRGIRLLEGRCGGGAAGATHQRQPSRRRSVRCMGGGAVPRPTPWDCGLAIAHELQSARVGYRSGYTQWVAFCRSGSGQAYQIAAIQAVTVSGQNRDGSFGTFALMKRAYFLCELVSLRFRRRDRTVSVGEFNTNETRLVSHVRVSGVLHSKRHGTRWADGLQRSPVAARFSFGSRSRPTDLGGRERLPSRLSIGG